MLPVQRRPPKSEGIFLPGPERLVSVLGVLYVQIPSVDRGRTSRSAQLPLPEDDLGGDLSPTTTVAPSGHMDDVDDVFVMGGDGDVQLQRDKQRCKKVTQWTRWTTQTIPSLLRCHLALLCQSESLCSMHRHLQFTCTCHGVSVRRLNVICIYFERESNFEFLVCLEFDYASLCLYLFDCASEISIYLG